MDVCAQGAVEVLDADGLHQHIHFTFSARLLVRVVRIGKPNAIQLPSAPLSCTAQVRMHHTRSKAATSPTKKGNRESTLALLLLGANASAFQTQHKCK